MEFSSSLDRYKLPVATLEFDSYEKLEKVKDIMAQQYQNELNKLLGTDPIIKEFAELKEFYSKTLKPFKWKLESEGVDPSSNKDYTNMLNKYIKMRSDWISKRNKKFRNR